MFSTLYRVTQKDFYARPYTSICAPVVARQISKRYSSSCHVFISIIDLRGLLENDSRTQSTVSSVTCCLGCFLDTVRTTVLYLNDIQAVELITPHMLINTWQELEYRLDICRATTGAHIEVYGRA